MLIAQITDMHVEADPAASNLPADTAAGLARAVEALNRLRPRPDVVVITGDLTNDGTEADYARLRELLEPLEIPSLLIPGNHDMSPTMARELAHVGYLPAEPPLMYSVDDFTLRLVAVDTTDPDRHDGVFDDERAAWLDHTLGQAPDTPTVVLMHHPPFETGIWWMDATGIDGAERFRAVIDAHDQVIRVLCGHQHRPIVANWGATLLSVCPSTAHQVACQFDDSEHPALTNEPAGLQLHRWDGEKLVTHTVPVEPAGATVDLAGDSAFAGLKKRIAGGGPWLKEAEGW
jgi:3',5'-cyclic AMP phosphodiesterase CpdA